MESEGSTLRDRSLGNFPYEDGKDFIELTGGEVCDPNFDIHEFRRLYKMYYPPKTKKEAELLQLICMGHNAPPELIEEVEHERRHAP